MLTYPKDLTPASLADIVLDVPRDAWPPLTWWQSDNAYPSGFIDGCRRQMFVEIAALAFCGSMAGRLLTDHDVVETVARVDGIVIVDVAGRKFSAPTLLQALAAACKGVAGE